MKRVKIVTHAGRAHRDEYMACCLAAFICYQNGQQGFIERRMVTEGDLDDPRTWVIDTGDIHDPSKLNFDHHQNCEKVESMCALDLLILHAFGAEVHKAFRVCNPWLALTAVHDNHGAYNAAQWLNIDMRSYNALKSPVERVALTRFSEVAVIYPHSPIYNAMIEDGRLIWNDISEVRNFQNVKLTDLPAASEHRGLRVWDVRKVDLSDSPMKMTMLNHEAMKRKVDITIGINGRDGQYNLHRQQRADSKVNFSVLEGQTGVLFAHKNGYYAVISTSLSDTEIMNLLTQAIPNSSK